MRSVSITVLEKARVGVARLWARLGRLRTLGQRPARIDLVPELIVGLDRMELCCRLLSRSLGRWVPRRGLRLPAALLWRALAALAGLGLTSALVTGLSAKDEEPQLASLATVATSDIAARPAATGDARSGGLGMSDWSPIPRPIAMFDLDSPELGRIAPAYEARRAPNGQREDVLVFSGFADAAPHLLMRLRTGPLDRPASASFTVDLVREAASHALSVIRSSAPAAIQTRFGPIETADVVLGDGNGNRSCLAFRSIAAAPGFAMSGWWCAATKPSDRRQLACLIDRLDLVNAAGSETLRTTFAKTELARDPSCTKPHLAAAGRKASWLDADGSVPALRAKTAAAEHPKITPPARPVRAKAMRRKR